MARFDSFGPFKIERSGATVTKKSLTSFWTERIEDSEFGLRDAVGVYIFAVRAKKSGPYKPWYVGRTDKQGFKDRFSNHELLFRKILELAKNGTLFAFMIAMRSQSGNKFRKPTKAQIDHNDWLESLIIGSCLSQNPKLLNVSKTKKLKTLVLPGIMNSPKGALSQSAKHLRALLEG